MNKHVKRFLITCLILFLITMAFYAVGLVVWQTKCPWPKRRAVRLTPRLGVLKEEDLTKDNPFYYIRQLTKYANVLDWQNPPPGFRKTAPPKPKAGFPIASGAPSDSAAVKELSRFEEDGYAPGAFPIAEERLAEAAPAFALCEKAASLGTEGQVVTA